MRLWLTAAEIADLALPGLPSTKRGVLDLAAREGWADRPGLARSASGRGGGTEYHVDVLPAEARATLAARQIGRVEVPEPLARAAAAEPEAARLAVPAAEGRDARLAILGAIDRFREAGGLSLVVADEQFCPLYSLGKVAVDAWIRQAVPALSPRTLARWRAEVRRGATHRLAVDHGAKRRGKGALEQEEIRLFILGCIARQPHLSSDLIRAAATREFPGSRLPSPRTFRHQLKIWRNKYKVELTQITNPDAFNNRYRTSGTHSHRVSRLNELWMIDASPADVLTVDGRHSVYAAIDIYSRRLQVYVTKTPRADAVGLLMRRAILAWGLPERVKTDNGSDFRAKQTVRLMASLGIEVETSTAFSPWQKGHVERAIRTLQHDCMSFLPGFVGHNVADRKAIEERRAFAQRLGESEHNVFCVDLSPADLQRHCDDWAAGRYLSRPHDGLNSVTPQQAAAGYVGSIRTVETHALDMLLAPIPGGDGIRTVTKRGIRIANAHYLTPSVLPETRVLVRQDPADMGRAWLFAEDGEEYLGEAVCPELAGIEPAAFVATTRAAHARMLKEGTAAIRAEMKRLTPADVAAMIQRQGAIDAGVLVEFPRQAEPHTTPALAAAAVASGSMMGAAAASAAGVPGGVEAEVPAAPAPDDAGVIRLPVRQDNMQDRYRRAMTLEAALAAGRVLDPADALWLTGYQPGSEYRTMREMFQEFGEAALR